MKKTCITSCMVLLFLGGWVMTQAAPQTNTYGSDVPIMNQAYDATEGALQVVSVGRGVTSPQTNTYGSTVPIYNFIYNSTLGALQVTLDDSSSFGLTEGSIVFGNASGGIGEDNSNLFWDDTNDRLGIGTASPSFPIQINRTSVSTDPFLTLTGRGAFSGGPSDEAQGASFGLVYNAAGNRQFWIGASDSGNGFRFLGVSNTINGYNMFTNTFQTLRLSSASISTLVLGNLSVGQNVLPDTALDVNGAITQRELSTDPSDPAEGSTVCWTSDGTGTGNDGDQLCKGTAGAVTTTGRILLQDPADSVTALQVLDADGGTPVFNVDTTNERVGIGTASPAGPLDVAGAISSNGTPMVYKPADSNTVCYGAPCASLAGSAEDNTLVGISAGSGITGGDANTYLGFSAGLNTANGVGNVSVGQYAGFQQVNGTNNVAIGTQSLYGVSGTGNIGIGFRVHDTASTMSNSIVIGYDLDLPSLTADNQMSIGNLLFSEGVNTATGQTIATGGLGVGVVSPDTRLDVDGAITSRELSADPSDPDEGSTVCWTSDGTGTGNDGQRLCKGTAGGVTTTWYNHGNIVEYSTDQTLLLGEYAGVTTPGTRNNGVGYGALRYNTADFSNGFGYTPLYNNTGDYANGFGYQSMFNNTGESSSAFGTFSLYWNTGSNASGFGNKALQFNAGSDSIGFGTSTLQYNNLDNNTAFGVESFNTFTDDSGSAVTFDNTDISGNNITATGHGFGSSGYINLRYAEGTSSVPGLVVGIIQFTIVDANTLAPRSNTITGPGTGTGHTLTPQYNYTNSAAIGYNAEPTASNQIMLGDTNTTEVTSTGTLVFSGDGTVWNDANVGAVSLGGPAVGHPDTVEIVATGAAATGIYTLGFADAEHASGVIEIPHSYKEGTDLYFHVHWSGNDAPSGTDYVKWQLTYLVSPQDAAVPAATVITVEDSYDTQYERVTTTFAAITGTTFNIGDQFTFALERVTAAGDAYAGDALLFTTGFHFEADTVGSRTITAK